jgi:MFS family permease
VNSVSFLGPIVAMYLLRNAQLNEARRRGPLRGSGKEGLALALRTPAILALLAAVALSNAPVEALRTLAPVLTQHSMGLTAGAAGVLVTAYSIGSTVGLLAFGWLAKHLRPRVLLASAFGAQAVGLIGVSLVSSLVPAAVLAAPIGLGFATNIPVLSAGLQVLSPEDFRGRIMSMFSMFPLGLRPFFSLSAGALATFVDVRIALATFVVFPVAAITLTARSARALVTATRGPGDPVRSA